MSKVELKKGQVWSSGTYASMKRMILELGGRNVMYVHPNVDHEEDFPFTPSICRVENLKRWIKESGAVLEREVHDEIVYSVLAQHAATAMHGPLYENRMRVLVADFTLAAEKVLELDGFKDWVNKTDEGKYALHLLEQARESGEAECERHE